MDPAKFRHAVAMLVRARLLNCQRRRTDPLAHCFRDDASWTDVSGADLESHDEFRAAIIAECRRIDAVAIMCVGEVCLVPRGAAERPVERVTIPDGWRALYEVETKAGLLVTVDDGSTQRALFWPISERAGKRSIALMPNEVNPDCIPGFLHLIHAAQA